MGFDPGALIYSKKLAWIAKMMKFLSKEEKNGWMRLFWNGNQWLRLILLLDKDYAFLDGEEIS